MLSLSISSWFAALLPRNCLLCGATAADALCADCRTDLPRLRLPACPICATPMPAPAPVCGDCLRHPPAFDATQAALHYTYPVDRLVQELKFGHRLASADFFAACLGELPPPSGDLVLPVPLAPDRLRERGFNQAVEIARPLARRLGLPLDTHGLARRPGPPQSLLPWRARRGNVRGVFFPRIDYSGRAVIVVDDVMTSGATLDALARTLKDHGAIRVCNLVVARAFRGSA